MCADQRGMTRWGISFFLILQSSQIEFRQNRFYDCKISEPDDKKRTPGFTNIIFPKPRPMIVDIAYDLEIFQLRHWETRRPQTIFSAFINVKKDAEGILNFYFARRYWWWRT
jgi:hypothetical protein